MISLMAVGVNNYFKLLKHTLHKIVETISNETKLGGEVILYLIQLTENFLLSLFLVFGLLISNFYTTIGLIVISSLVLLVLKSLGIFKSVERGRKLVKYNQNV